MWHLMLSLSWVSTKADLAAMCEVGSNAFSRTQLCRRAGYQRLEASNHPCVSIIVNPKATSSNPPIQAPIAHPLIPRECSLLHPDEISHSSRLCDHSTSSIIETSWELVLPSSDFLPVKALPVPESDQRPFPSGASLVSAPSPLQL